MDELFAIHPLSFFYFFNWEMIENGMPPSPKKCLSMS